MRALAIALVGLLATLTPAVAEPYFSCAYTNAIGVSVLGPDRVRINYRGHSFEAPADLQRTRSFVFVSFGFDSMGTAHRLMLVATLDGTVTLERREEPLASTRQRIFPCQAVR